MASTSTYILATVPILLYFIVKSIRNAVDKKSVMATPSISLDNAVITAFASTKIKGTVDEVFDFVIRYKDCGEELTFSQYNWEDVDDEGVPFAGSVGTFKMDIDPFGPRVIRIKLDVLDREKKKVSDVTTKYPPWLLASERVQEVLPVPDHPGICEYRTYMTAQGLAAYYLLWFAREDVIEGQRQCAENLGIYFLAGAKRLGRN